jgi:Ca2+-binding RTX toxin-like protein
MARNYRVIQTTNNPLNGSEVLEQLESFIEGLQIPFIDPVNLSGYANKNWNSTSYTPDASKNDYTSSASGSNIQFTETNSNSGNNYLFDFEFNQSNGDELTFFTSTDNSGSFANSSGKEKNTLTWKYFGNSPSAEDDYFLNVTFDVNSNKLNSKNPSTGIDSGSYKGNGQFLLDFKNSEVIFNLRGSWSGSNSYIGNIDPEDQEIHTITRFSYENLIDKFSLVFSGTLTQDNLANTETANLKKVTFTMDGVKYDSSNFKNVSEGAGFLMRDQPSSFSEEDYVNNYFLPAVIKTNNVITGTSGSDTILGSQGNDRINGGAGDDTLDLSRFDWTLNDGEADSYSVSGNEKSFTITHQDNGKTHTMAVSNVEFVAIGGETYSVQKFLNPNAREITGGDILEQLYIDRPDYLPGALMDVDMSEYVNQDWSTAVLKPDATKNNLSFKTNSSPPSTLKLLQNKTAETAKGFKDAITVNFASSAGDKLTFKSLEEAVNTLDANNNRTGGSSKDFASIIWNYVGDKSTQADNVSINYVSNQSVSDTANSNNTRTMIDTSSTNLKYSDVQYKLNGSLIYKSNANTDQAYNLISKINSVSFSRYSFQDLESGFSISFSGSIQENYSTNQVTLSLKNFNVSTPDFTINTRLIQSDQSYDDVILGLSDGESLADIENSFLAILDELVLSASNVITIKNNDGYTVFAGDGNDRVTGGKGDDVISGGKGKDTLSGGQGADIFVISGNDLVNADVDIILDFSKAQGDMIAFDTSTGIDFDPSYFVSQSGSVAQSENAKFIYDNKKGNLYYDADANGDSPAILIASFSNKPALSADDFMNYLT